MLAVCSNKSGKLFNWFGEGDIVRLGSGRKVTEVGVRGGDFEDVFRVFCLGGKAGGTTELLLDDDDSVALGECKGEGPLKINKLN